MGSQPFTSIYNGTLTPPKSIPEGGLPYPSWYYNPVFSPYINDVSKPRLRAQTHQVPGVVENNPGNTVANSRNFDYPRRAWYVQKYHERKTNAQHTRVDPLNYLTGERFPFANRGVRAYDSSTGHVTLSMNPKSIKPFKLTDYNY
jgi:hypothetical protein